MQTLKFIIALAFLLLLSCGKSDYDDYETRIEYFENIRPQEELTDSILTISNWNIQLGFKVGQSPWSDAIGGSSAHLDTIVTVLGLADPDVIVLTEVPLDRENTIVKKVLDTIGTRLNYNYAFGAHGFNSNGSYPTRAQWGNAILSKYPIIEIENREILNYNDKWTRRSVLRAGIRFNSNLLVDNYCLHYEASFENPCDSLGQLARTMEFLEESNRPKIIGGDFNCDGYRMDDFFPFTPSLVYHDSLLWGSNDRMYISNHFDPLSFEQVEESRGISDHVLTIATVKLK